MKNFNIDQFISSVPVLRLFGKNLALNAGIAFVIQDFLIPLYSGYILNIVFATREPDKFSLSKLSDLITFGASPRASINLVLASKAKAFIDGRGYVIPEDVKYVAKDILRHRILLSYEAEAEEISSEDIIDQLLQEIPVP